MLTNPAAASWTPSNREALMKLEFTVVSICSRLPALADIVPPVAFGMGDEVGYWPGWYNEVSASRWSTAGGAGGSWIINNWPSGWD
jgi:hypothetical protein